MYKYGALITLTYDDSYNSHDRLRDRALFLDFLRKRSKRSGSKMAYVYTTEATLRDNLHFHILYCSDYCNSVTSWAYDYGILRGSSNMVDVSYLDRRDLNKTETYLTKYLTKSNKQAEFNPRVTTDKDEQNKIDAYIKAYYTSRLKIKGRLWASGLPFKLSANYDIPSEHVKYLEKQTNYGVVKIPIFKHNQFKLLKK